MPTVDRTLVLSVLAALVLGGALSAAGIASAKTEAPAQPAGSTSSTATQEPESEASSSDGAGSEEEKDDGSAKAATKAATLKCADKTTCKVVFTPPTDEAVKPFGLTVKLVQAQDKKVAISVDGKKYSVGSGKSVKVKGATVKLVGSSDSSVALEFRRT